MGNTEGRKGNLKTHLIIFQTEKCFMHNIFQRQRSFESMLKQKKRLVQFIFETNLFYFNASGTTAD